MFSGQLALLHYYIWFDLLLNSGGETTFELIHNYLPILIGD